MRDIARAVGIRESSIYNHFENKRAVFDGIVDFCVQQSEAYFRGAAHIRLHLDALVPVQLAEEVPAPGLGVLADQQQPNAIKLTFVRMEAAMTTKERILETALELFSPAGA